LITPPLHAAYLPKQAGIGFALPFAFVIGVAVGFVFSNIILFGNRLDQIP
jgi:hypothetical protein